jgi:hypothetical protein
VRHRAALLCVAALSGSEGGKGLSTAGLHLTPRPASRSVARCCWAGLGWAGLGVVDSLTVGSRSGREGETSRYGAWSVGWAAFRAPAAPVQLASPSPSIHARPHSTCPRRHTPAASRTPAHRLAPAGGPRAGRLPLLHEPRHDGGGGHPLHALQLPAGHAHAQDHREHQARSRPPAAELAAPGCRCTGQGRAGAAGRHSLHPSPRCMQPRQWQGSMGRLPRLPHPAPHTPRTFTGGRTASSSSTRRTTWRACAATRTASTSRPPRCAPGGRPLRTWPTAWPAGPKGLLCCGAVPPLCG